LATSGPRTDRLLQRTLRAREPKRYLALIHPVDKTGRDHMSAILMKLQAAERR
jgi:hypothetical protein